MHVGGDEPGAAAARLTDALRGGPHALGPERAAAAEVERRWPGTGEQFRRAAGFHAQAALEAVTAWGARSVILAGAGYPVSGWEGAVLPHPVAAIAAPGSRYLYCSADEAITLLWQRVLRHDRRASACQAPAADPRQVAGMARMAGLEPPWSVQLQLCAHWWTGEQAAAVIAGYAEAGEHAEALPPGSTLVLTVPVAGGQHPRGEMGRLAERVTGVMPASHAPEGIAGWIKGAGLELAWGPADVRAWPGRQWADGDLAAPLGTRVVGVVAVRR